MRLVVWPRYRRQGLLTRSWRAFLNFLEDLFA